MEERSSGHRSSKPSVNAATKSKQSFFSRLRPFSFDDRSRLLSFFLIFRNDTWKEYEGVIKPTQVDEIKVVTWNILFDLYSERNLQTDKRIPIILKILQVIYDG